MKYTLEELMLHIDEPNRQRCIDLLRSNIELFSDAKGSNSKHQAWRGGYLDHVTEVMNIAVLLYHSLGSVGREINFGISDALLVLFLHDLEKPFKQKNPKDFMDDKGNKINSLPFKLDILRKYEIRLTEQQHNAMKYVEGEGNDYSRDRIMNKLAAFCHMCDIWSARGWYDYPKRKCNFDVCYSGPCGKDIEGPDDYCQEHKDIKCGCGEKATGECNKYNGSFVCGMPVCDECRKYKHRHR